MDDDDESLIKIPSRILAKDKNKELRRNLKTIKEKDEGSSLQTAPHQFWAKEKPNDQVYIFYITVID